MVVMSKSRRGVKNTRSHRGRLGQVSIIRPPRRIKVDKITRGVIQWINQSPYKIHAKPFAWFKRKPSHP